MTDKCPFCGEDLYQDICNEEINDFETDHEIICSHCEHKIIVSMHVEYDVAVPKGTFVCPKCGEDWFDEKFTFDVHTTYCKGQLGVLKKSVPNHSYESEKNV
jgi:transcription initiation factor IIE alpha subunit